GVAGRLESQLQGLQDMVLRLPSLGTGLSRRLLSRWFQDTPNFSTHGLVHGRSSEADAARLGLVQPTSPAGVADAVGATAGVAKGQLAFAAPAVQQACQQGTAPLGWTWLILAHDVLGNLGLDRQELLPLNVAWVGPWEQHEPVLHWLAP